MVPRRVTEAPPEPLQEVAYLYDGTLEGLLSAVFLAYERKELPRDIVRASHFEPRLGQSEIWVETDVQRAQRVRAGVVRKAGAAAFTAIMRASTCEDYRMGVIVFQFIRHVMARTDADRSNPVLEDLANPIVSDLCALARRAVNETEKMRQFVRFSHLENGVWYAEVNPHASVVALVMPYFSSRLNDQPFIIYDARHKIAGVYDGAKWELVAAEALNIPAAAEGDDYYKEAWKRFYDALGVDARYHPELRRHFMPKRFWADLPEMQPREQLEPDGRAIPSPQRLPGKAKQSPWSLSRFG